MRSEFRFEPMEGGATFIDFTPFVTVQ